MKKLILHTIRIAISFSISVVGAVVLFFVTGFIWWAAILGGGATYFLVSAIFRRKFLPANQDVVKEERAYVKKNIREIKPKVKEIGSYRYKVRSIRVYQTVNKVHKILKQILEIAEREPQRYRNVQSVFTTYVDSTLLIVKKYSELASQPVKNKELYISMREVEETLEELAASIEKELLQILSDDITDLDIECKLVKQSLQETGYSFEERTKEQTASAKNNIIK
ncbi:MULTISPECIES: 5-bromo-4-chloroindolyl phosphate hydrolysis family protein [Bacillaceae]|uniref:5-bromo-4-chloroindolyl phosphate hydrolysis family protein n=1 Tax=Bacillaceae TaxID=186817 RepID=UPI001BDEF5F7|nr:MULTISPECIES: 5-bromo-4-chloroindolyl phosphate hydrolysis family protein [Bacillaceae]MDX8361010.1 5-bromo-4-chloroindolyl phosphate hydrolysis family protein [Cytobacillus sp. IB215316]